MRCESGFYLCAVTVLSNRLSGGDAAAQSPEKQKCGGSDAHFIGLSDNPFDAI